MVQSILVTGGAGYIGSHACKALAASGYNPVVYDNLSRGRRHAVRWGPFVEGDLHDRDRLVATMRYTGVEAAMHFAAFAYVPEFVADPALYYRNNLVGSLALLDAMREAGGRPPGVFLQLCRVRHTGQRPDPRDDAGPAGEPLPARPSWRSSAPCLGTSRLTGCALSRCAISMRPGPIVTARSARARSRNAVIRWSSAPRWAGAADRIFGSDYPTADGTAIREYIHVADLAAAHAGAPHILPRSESVTLDLGAGPGHSVRKVVGVVERLPAGVPRRKSPRRPGDPPELVADHELSLERLDWCPLDSDLDTIVRTALAWETRSAARG